MVSVGKAAEHGILVRNGEALQRARSVDTVVLDKTGTVTRGQPALTDIVSTGDLTEEELLLMAAAAEVNSEHPLGVAIVSLARDRGLQLPAAASFLAEVGGGVRAEVDGSRVLVGTGDLLSQGGVPEMADMGCLVGVYVGVFNDHLAASGARKRIAHPAIEFLEKSFPGKEEIDVPPPS